MTDLGEYRLYKLDRDQRGTPCATCGEPINENRAAGFGEDGSRVYTHIGACAEAYAQYQQTVDESVAE